MSRNCNVFSLRNDIDSTFFGLILSLATVWVFMMPGSAMASAYVQILGYPLVGWTPPPDPVRDAMLTIVAFFNGAVGKAFATVAVIAAGFGAFFQRISWVQALIVTLGVGIVFGAANILHAVTGGDNGQIAIRGATGSTALVCQNVGSPFGISIPLNRACDGLRNIINTISRGTGAAIATMAILMLGVGALYGKITYLQAFTLALGIAMVFGAVSLVETIWANPGDCLLNNAMALIMGHEVEFILCRFLSEIRGDTGKFLACFAVMIMGFMALMGRLSLTVALVTVIGIVMVFGSSAIVDIIVPNGYNCNTFSLALDFNTLWPTRVIQGVLCNILLLVTGVPGKALASSAVVMLGFGAMLGKISFGSALIVATGIAIAFGAPQIVFLLTAIPDACILAASSISVDVNLCAR